MIQIVTKDKKINSIKKKYIFIFLILINIIILNIHMCYATDLINTQADNIGINTYINEINKYVDNDFKIDFNNLFQNLIKGDTSGIKQTLLDKVLSIFGEEVKENITIIISILIIVLISSLLNSLTNGFGKSQVSNIRFFYIIYYNNYISNDQF